MTTDATGNVLKVPGFTQGTATTDDEILASYAGLTQKGLTIKGDQAAVLKTGTVLVVSTTAKKYKGAAKADVAGAVGILRKDVDATAAGGGDKLANVILAGRVKGSNVKYTDDKTTKDSNTNPAGYLSISELGTLATALGGRYDVVHDMLIF